MLKLSANRLLQLKFNDRHFVCSYFRLNDHNRTFSYDVRSTKQISALKPIKGNHVLNTRYKNDIFLKTYLISQFSNSTRYFSNSPTLSNSPESTNTSSDFVDEILTDIPVGRFSGIFATISGSTPVVYVQNLLVSFHNTTGLPWWATIVLAALAMRTVVMLPLTVYQHYIAAKCRILEPEINVIAKRLQNDVAIEAKRQGLSSKRAKNMYMNMLKREKTKLYVRDNCHPMKQIIIIIGQSMLWITLSVAVRNLCFMAPFYDKGAFDIYVELRNSGFGWISNLVTPDPYWIIPISYGIFHLINVEIQNMLIEKKVNVNSKYQIFRFNYLRALTVFIVCISGFVPSCVSLYWMTSSAHGLFQNLLLYSPRFRRLARIPKTANENPRPYSHVWSKVKSKFTT